MGSIRLHSSRRYREQRWKNFFDYSFLMFDSTWHNIFFVLGDGRGVGTISVCEYERLQETSRRCSVHGGYTASCQRKNRSEKTSWYNNGLRDGIKSYRHCKSHCNRHGNQDITKLIKDAVSGIFKTYFPITNRKKLFSKN